MVFMDNNPGKTLPVGFSPTYTQWENIAQPWATEPCVGDKNLATVREYCGEDGIFESARNRTEKKTHQKYAIE
jgi:hypothetical protein